MWTRHCSAQLRQFSCECVPLICECAHSKEYFHQCTQIPHSVEQLRGGGFVRWCGARLIQWVYNVLPHATPVCVCMCIRMLVRIFAIEARTSPPQLYRPQQEYVGIEHTYTISHTPHNVSTMCARNVRWAIAANVQTTNTFNYKCIFAARCACVCVDGWMDGWMYERRWLRGHCHRCC